MSETRSNREGARRHPPIASHRLFPWVCGLWFATLFMLCSLVVPAALLERGVAALGVDRVFPAASSPLGETSRLLIAVGLSTIGEISGLVLGRILAARVRKPKAAPLAIGADDDACATHAAAPFLVKPPLSLEDIAAESPREPLPVVASASLDQLGIVQLSERLAIAMQVRRERLARSDDVAGDDDSTVPLAFHPRFAPASDRSPEALRQRPEALAALRQLSAAR